MRFTTRQFIMTQCRLEQIRETLKKPRPMYVYYSQQFLGVHP